jgi:hypothetical protein
MKLLTLVGASLLLSGCGIIGASLDNIRVNSLRILNNRGLSSAN